MAVRKIQAYCTSDDRLFDSQEAAARHEIEIAINGWLNGSDASQELTNHLANAMLTDVDHALEVLGAYRHAAPSVAQKPRVKKVAPVSKGKKQVKYVSTIDPKTGSPDIEQVVVETPLPVRDPAASPPPGAGPKLEADAGDAWGD